MTKRKLDEQVGQPVSYSHTNLVWNQVELFLGLQDSYTSARIALRRVKWNRDLRQWADIVTASYKLPMNFLVPAMYVLALKSGSAALLRRLANHRSVNFQVFVDAQKLTIRHCHDSNVLLWLVRSI